MAKSFKSRYRQIAIKKKLRYGFGARATGKCYTNNHGAIFLLFDNNKQNRVREKKEQARDVRSD